MNDHRNQGGPAQRKRRLITSALPYVNNIPHLGNLIQVLSADVFARFCRSAGYETLYVCGTDEYGTATETKALEEGVSPRELCDRYHAIHRDIYQWFGIGFDRFGRTSDPKQTEITQSIFLGLDKNGYVVEKTTEQLYNPEKNIFLADRYVRGTCPHCFYAEARGDQCENCGKLLEPTELIEPYSPQHPGKLEVRPTKHLYINLPAILPKLQEWMTEASVKGSWARNAVKMTEAWIRDGLKERAITRDLKWGIPVPKEGFDNKVFYVWFDAPIGYISITAHLTDDWESWWKNPENVELFQFIGKDNIPFHTVIFPSSLLGSGENWTMLHHMSSSEYLNYESGKFSKSAGVGVFGTDAKETGIPADVWRFYLFYNRPEKSDTLFTWKDFQEKINTELIGNLANLVNRSLSFAGRFFDGQVPQAESDPEFWAQVRDLEGRIGAHLERAELKDGLKLVLELSALGNKTFQDGEPWKAVKEDPPRAARLLKDLIYLVRDLAILVEPYMPATAQSMAGFLGIELPTWESLGQLDGLGQLGTPEILFKKLEEKQMEELRDRFSGSQKERAARDQADAAKAGAAKAQKADGKGSPESAATEPAPENLSPEELFAQRIRLRTVKITAVEQHPEAERLYIETIDLGNGEESTIVSGLVAHYKAEELLGKTVVLAANLKPAKLRGVKSHGMLLAAEEDGVVEVLFPDCGAGEEVVLEGTELPQAEAKKIDIDKFFEVPIRVQDGTVMVGDKVLTVQGQALRTSRVKNGKVG